MRDAMKVGVQVLFSHSNVRPTRVARVCEIAGEPHPNPTRFDPASKDHDPRAIRTIRAGCSQTSLLLEAPPRPVSIDELRASKSLAKMSLSQRGQRLSVQPVTAAGFRTVLRIAAKRPVTFAGS
jgi:predicted RNA-binding protein with PUA-like domain